MPLGHGQVFAGYTIVRLLGSGGIGEVYLAQHPRLPREDALGTLARYLSVPRHAVDRALDLGFTPISNPSWYKGNY
jgi:serine/threonine protein kinase, bacterial